VAKAQPTAETKRVKHISRFFGFLSEEPFVLGEVRLSGDLAGYQMGMINGSETMRNK